MFANQERINEAVRGQVAAQINAFQSVSEHVFDALEKFSALNLSAARATIGQSQEIAKEVFEAKDMNGVLDGFGKVVAPVQAQAAEYQRTAGEIVSSAVRGIGKVAEEYANNGVAAASKFGAEVSAQAPFSAQQAASAMQDAVERTQANVVALAEQAAGSFKAMQQQIAGGGRGRKKQA
jgi:phasin family protein